MNVTTTKSVVFKLIGLVNYYRNIWSKRLHTFQLLTRSMSKKFKFKWTEIIQKVFDEVKTIVECNTLLYYTYLNYIFSIHTNTSHFQVGVFIIKGFRPIDLYI